MSDAAVIARMHAAESLLRGAGVDVDVFPGAPGDTAALLRRAVHWQRYGGGPVTALHRSCGRDISRGALRLWALAGGVPEVVRERPPSARTRIQIARVQLSAQARILCAALRADLAAESAGLSRRGVGSFGDRVGREVARVAHELDEAVTGRLAELGLPTDHAGWPDIPVGDRLPPRRRPRLENRLTALVGVGFGAGVSLTVGRVIADLRPDWTPAAALGCGLLGVALTAWTVLARSLLAERAAAERWMLEAVANLRPALEERVLTRMLIAEALLAPKPAGRPAERRVGN